MKERKERGVERRNWEHAKQLDTKPPKGFVERRRISERRKPDVTEGSLEEFENLMKSSKEGKNQSPDPSPSGFDKVVGRL